ncbi:hypothetical protein NDN01_03185 [Sphingomonas sp. QA11]|uniref:hypothetical protein n=1 Tax=Sphingomonas sp. QA11 TaxID=2950605 RepID=UPI00234A680F|nr:hypothetical protein [Sphingomonas sp. QA11]WCM27949.1 hypothetical protein NDN01_03185 [Sphingomonas sp. QA11]
MKYIGGGLLFIAVASAGVYLLEGAPPQPKSDTIQVVEGRAVQPRALPTLGYVPSPSYLLSSASPQVTYNMASSALEMSRGEVINEPDVKHEKRDITWAVPTEIAVRDMIARIPYIDTTTITVLCGATVCRATGSIQARISDSNRQVANLAIINEEFYTPNPDINFIPKRSVANVGLEGTFSVEFSRIGK